jgi:hypothetical protein
MLIKIANISFGSDSRQNNHNHLELQIRLSLGITWPFTAISHEWDVSMTKCIAFQEPEPISDGFYELREETYFAQTLIKSH